MTRLKKTQEVSTVNHDFNKKPGYKTYPSGATRSSDVNHVAFHLLSPIGMKRLAARAQLGADKHGELNYEQGMPVTEFLNHAVNHIYEFLAGNRTDDDLAAACWNCLAAMHLQETRPDLNNNLRGPNCSLPPMLLAGDPGRGKRQKQAKNRRQAVRRSQR